LPGYCAAGYGHLPNFLLLISSFSDKKVVIVQNRLFGGGFVRRLSPIYLYPIQLGWLLPLIARIACAAVPVEPTITVTVPAEVTYQQGFTVMVTVGGENGPGTGAVDLVIDGNAYLPAAVLSNGMASFTIPGPQVPSGQVGNILGLGGHEIGVNYAGAPGNPANYTPQLFTTNQAAIAVLAIPPPPPVPVTLNLKIGTSLNPSTVGQPLTITATLNATGGTPGGSVQFYDGTTLLGIVPVTNNQAAFTTNSLAAGSHDLSVKYTGDGTFQPAQASIGEFISGMASTVTLTASASTAPAGQTLTFTAQVGPAPPANYAAQTGQVLFQDNGYPIGTVNLASGIATLSTTALAVGTHTITAVYSGDATWGSSFGRTTVTITVAPLFLTNAATNLSTVFAPDEIVSLFNVQGLNGDTSGTLPLGTSLGGTSVTITDSTGTSLPALLFGVYASARQINFVIPSGTAIGAATSTVMPPSGASQTLQIQIANLAPGIFSVNQNGQGTFAGQIVIVHADGSQTVESSATMITSGGTTTYRPTPISFAVPTDQVFLQLYGTGLRHAGTVTATINGATVPVQYAGAEGILQGLDQVNLQVPSYLAGTSTVNDGTANIVITADGQATNKVTTFIPMSPPSLP
jgi:uncharacterized protein (TIGR03437 family)